MTYADQFAALGSEADGKIAAVTQQPPGTINEEFSRNAGTVVDAAVAAAKPPPPPPPPVGSFPGDTLAGHIRWGLSQPIADQSVPEGVHRTYFQSPTTQWQAMVAQAKADLARGCVSWMSYKPGSWAAAGTGAIDAGLDNLFHGLAGLGGPVFVTPHHEPVAVTGTPDDPSGHAGFIAMAKRGRQRLDASGAANVAYVSVHMSGAIVVPNFSTQWVDPTIFHALGFDIYQKTGKDITANPNFAKICALAVTFKQKLMIGEWGVLDGASQATATVNMNASRDAFLRNEVVAAAYFNSNANSVADWTLRTARLAAWTDQAKAASSVPASKA